MAFIFLGIQAFIVMKLNQYPSIQFKEGSYLVIVWIVNFFIAFSILTQLKPWLQKQKWLYASSVDEK